MSAGPRGTALWRRRRDEVAALLTTDAACAAIALHGTPVLLLEPDRVTRQHRRLRDALPFVDVHYAVKALDHDAVLDALDAAGCGFDVATTEELALLVDRGVAPERIIHTHPIKKPAEIAAALDAGIRTFVVDNPLELAKFRGAPRDVRLLLRLSYRSPRAKSDLSAKFGVGPDQARRMVAASIAQGTPVRGFTFHVGSQLDDPERYVRAIGETAALMSRCEDEFGIWFDTLDIGGGFAVAYDEDVVPFERTAARIRPLLERLRGRYRILAEPGRFLVAEAMTLVAGVAGSAERADGCWHYLDDGVYGAYSNVVAEDVHPLVFAQADLDGRDGVALRAVTLAGPTCDSGDVIARQVLLPVLEVGDLIASPAMGAYTAVTATRFNGRAATPIAVLTPAPVTGGFPAPPEASAAGSARLAQTVP